MDAFGIINMNGRVYDPLTAQFFSPDPYVQAPDNWLNYNRYAYAFGNPFKYTDPSGYVFGIDDLIIIGFTIISAYLGGVNANHGELNPLYWDYKNPGTYFGIGFGAFFGYAGGYWLLNPSAFSIGLGITIDTPWLSLGVGVSGLTTTGVKSDFKFRWSTSAEGEGELSKNNNKKIKLTPQKSYWDGNYYTGSTAEARDILYTRSLVFGLESTGWITSKGYYFDKFIGDAYGLKYSKAGLNPTDWYVIDYNDPIGYRQNQYDSSCRYLKLYDVRGEHYSGVGDLYIGTNIFNMAQVFEHDHTHPRGISYPSLGHDDVMAFLLNMTSNIVYGYGKVSRYWTKQWKP